MLIVKEEVLRAKRAYYDENGLAHIAVPVESIRAMPDAQPRGIWIYAGRDKDGRKLFRCNVCTHTQALGGNFCSNCGRRNEERKRR